MSNLSWAEMRSRATRFQMKWRAESRERAEKDTFWNEFFHVFGIDRRRVAVFEQLASRHSTGGRGFVDVLWPGYLVGEQKSRGADLARAMEEQALDYLPSLPPEDLPRLVVVSDFARFRVRNQLDGSEIEFPIDELPARIRAFAPLLDAEVQQYATEEEVNLAATDLLALLHDALKESGYQGHALRVLLVRLVFVMFADDSLVWENGLFYDYLTLKTSLDGHDLGPALIHLFQVLDTAPERRSELLDDDLKRFTYINGSLFAEAIPIPDCSRGMRNRLLKACRFDWSKISPAIFGSLFQNVMEDFERRDLGAHYTTEQNILRTINPLFVDDLRTELARAATVPALRRVQDRLASLTFFDPACGCGNFLIIAYREIRQLELECLRRIRDLESRAGADTRHTRLPTRSRAGSAVQLVEGQFSLDVTVESKVHVGQFFGIEIEEFPAKIAETAIYLIDHLENLALSNEFGEYYARFPISDTAHIRHGNALRIDWADVLPPERCDYLFGNPPFHGMAWMNADQQEDNRRVFGDSRVTVSRSGRLDYVACWYAKALDYMRNQATKGAFVSTNSITQGEQARSLGPAVRDAGYQIDFAYRTFAWTSEARGRAHVHVVIVGFSHGRTPTRKTLFDFADVRALEPIVTTPQHINWYLADGPDVFPDKRSEPLFPGLPEGTKGSQPTDGKHLLITEEQLGEVMADPLAAKYVRPYRQSKELLHDLPRWCLWLAGANPGDLRSSPVLRERLTRVRAARLASPTASVRAQANTPSLFTQIRQPAGRYIAVPEASSGTRTYIPVSLLEPEVIAGNKLICWHTDDLWLFGVLSSRAFTLWTATIAGRLKSDYSLAPDITYCTFPMPDPEDARRQRIAELAQGVLDARAAHAGASLAVLYDPLAMPADLVAAHVALDRVVDAGIAGTRSQVPTDAARLHAMFRRYVALTSADALPGMAQATAPRKRAAKRVRRASIADTAD